MALKQEIDFFYDKEIPDTQVDISPAFLFSDDQQKKVWTSGGNKETLEADLKTLDKSKVYFLRTDSNQGAGHWHTLYFDPAQKGWVDYSTPKNNYLLTENEKLTRQGQGLLASH